jgi:hypothetical protein
MEALQAWVATQPPSDFLSLQHTLTRYLEASRGDVEAAKAALLASVAWRAATLQPNFSCAPCAATPGEHCFIPLGADATGAALVYGCPARASGSGNIEHTIAHVAHALEKQFTGEAGGPAPRQWVWIVDFSGFGLTHALQARLGLSFGYMFREQFPERLKRIVLINPPLLFRGLLAALSAIADERTVAKLTPLTAGTPEEVVAALRYRFDVHNEEALAWLQVVLRSPPTPGTLPPLPPAAVALQV